MYEKRIALMHRRRLKPVAKSSTTMGHVKQSQHWLKLPHAQRSITMQQITITFSDDDTLPDRLRMMADEIQVPVEALIIRAIDEHLGDKYLKKPPNDIQAKSLGELFQAYGLTKPKT